MKKHKKLFIILGIALFIIIVPLISYIVHKNSTVSVSVTTLSKDVDDTTTINGTVTSLDKKEIFLDPTKGSTYSINIKKGDNVEEGDSIISYNTEAIDSKISAINDQINDKKKQLKSLKDNLNKLEDSKSTSIQGISNLNPQTNALEGQKTALNEKISLINSDIKTTESTLKELKSQKNGLNVITPISGTIVAINTNNNNPAIPLVVIESKNKMVKGEITEYEIPKINSEMPVSLSFKALGNEACESKIVDISNNPSMNTQVMQGAPTSNVSNYQVTFEIPEGQQEKVCDGFHCIVKIGNSSDDIVIPKDSVYKEESDGSKFVWTVQDNKLCSKKIKVKIVEDKLVLLEGLKEGDKVVNKPSSKLKAGEEVTIQ